MNYSGTNGTQAGSWKDKMAWLSEERFTPAEYIQIVGERCSKKNGAPEEVFNVSIAKDDDLDCLCEYILAYIKGFVEKVNLEDVADLISLFGNNGVFYLIRNKNNELVGILPVMFADIKYITGLITDCQECTLVTLKFGYPMWINGKEEHSKVLCELANLIIDSIWDEGFRVIPLQFSYFQPDRTALGVYEQLIYPLKPAEAKGKLCTQRVLFTFRSDSGPENILRGDGSAIELSKAIRSRIEVLKMGDKPINMTF